MVRGGQRCGERCGHGASCGRGEGPRNGTGKGGGGAHGTVTLGPGTSTLRVHTDASLSCYVEGNAFPASGHPPGRGSRRPLAQPLPLVTEVVLTSETGRDANTQTAGAGYGASIWGDKGDPQHVTRKGARLQN